MSSLEAYVLDMMEGKRPGRFFLQLLSYLFQLGVFLRHHAYKVGLFKSFKSEIPVISVGNIVAGGTGKTPLVRLLAEALEGSGKIAILSRGYRSKIEHSREVVKIAATEKAVRCGDEPLWLAQQLPQADVWVGKDRVRSAELAQQAGAELLILDDGMQYRKLQREWEIVVMDSSDLFGKGYFLPRGLLRESPQRLAAADLIVVNQAKKSRSVLEALAPYTKAPVVFMEMKSHVDLSGKKVGVFCALGQPQRFLHTVQASGAQVMSTFFKTDHEPFTVTEIEAFALRSQADLLVCTEKDQVKFAPDFACTLPILPLPGVLEIVEGQAHWDKLIEKIKHKVKHELSAKDYTS